MDGVQKRLEHGRLTIENSGVFPCRTYAIVANLADVKTLNVGQAKSCALDVSALKEVLLIRLRLEVEAPDSIEIGCIS